MHFALVIAMRIPFICVFVASSFFVEARLTDEQAALYNNDDMTITGIPSVPGEEDSTLSGTVCASGKKTETKETWVRQDGSSPNDSR